MGTGVVVHPLVADPPEDKMSPDFFGNGGAVFAESVADLGEGRAVVQHGLDDSAFFEGKVFLISHVSTSLCTGTQRVHYNTKRRAGEGRPGVVRQSSRFLFAGLNSPFGERNGNLI